MAFGQIESGWDDDGTYMNFGIPDTLYVGEISLTGTLTADSIDARIITADTIEVADRFVPSADDGVSLGVSGIAFSDVFLATGGVLDWNATDKLTHSANTMTASGFTTWDMGAVTTVDFDAGVTFTSVADMDFTSSGAGFNFTTDTDAGDDFIINSTAFVVEGDDGNVGIGTASPNTLFEVKGKSGTRTIDGASKDLIVRISDGDDGDSHLNIAQGGHDFYFVAGKDNNGQLKFATRKASADITRMTILNDGKVGIGTTSPQKALHVDVAAGVALRLQGEYAQALELKSDGANANARNWYMMANDVAYGTLQFEVSANNSADPTLVKMVMDKDGNVGIGTTEPGTLLQLAKDGDAYLTLQNLTNEHTEGAAETKIIFEDHANAALGQIEVSHSGTSDDTKGKMIFSTHDGSSLTTALTIDNSANSTFGTSGIVFTGGETANTFMNAGGFTLQQSTNDGDILGMKSTDISHSFTDFAEADTYARFKKVGNAGGGLEIAAMTDSDLTAMVLKGFMGVTNPTDATPAIQLRGYKWDGGTTAAVLADAETILAIANGSTDKILFKGDGDIFFLQASSIRATNQLITVDGGTGGVRVDNTLGIGVEPIASAGIYARGTISTATTNNIAAFQSTLTTSGATVQGRALVVKPDAMNFTDGTAGVKPLAVSAYFAEPNISLSSGSITEAATVYILDAPTEGDDNYALHVAAGNSRFDGKLHVGTGTYSGTPTLNVNESISGYLVEFVNPHSTSGQGLKIKAGDSNSENALYVADKDNTERFTVKAGGTVDVVGDLTAGTLGVDGNATFGGDVSVPTKTPSSASDTGTTGTITWDANYIYVCTATNTWKRVAIATW